LRRIWKISVEGVGADGAVVYREVTETSGDWQDMIDPSNQRQSRRGGREKK
jgi:hypothetical protein